MTDDNIPTQTRPIPDDLANRMEATLSTIRETADLMEEHFSQCPETTIEEAAEVRSTSALFRMARRPVMLVPDAVVQLAELTERVNAVRHMVEAHIERCPPAKAS